MTLLAGGLVLLILGWAGTPQRASAAAAAPPRLASVPEPPGLSGEAKEIFRFRVQESARFAGPERPEYYPPADEDPPIDVVHYRIALDLEPYARFFRGHTRIEGVVRHDGLAAVVLDYCGPTNLAVEEGGVPRSHVLIGSKLHVIFGAARAAGDSFAIEVAYEGTVTRGLYWPVYAESPSTFTFSEPEDARYWFPCHDVPWDKATADLVITVPPGHVAASNGVLVAEEPASGGRRTFHWREQHPIATYLIAVAVAPYAVLHDDRVPGVPIVHFVYRPDSAAGRRAFDTTPAMLEFFADRFGPYPFDKYGHAGALFPGGMEHQSLSLVTENAVRDSAAWQWLLAHELAHQWWGDAVTPRDWRHIWLNEGFATYADALWREHTQGADSLRSRMALFQFFYEGALQFVRIPLVNPPARHFLSATIYDKGAWVLHMLRRVVGDDTFFHILREYHAAHRYGHAVTDDFVAVCERVTGRSFGWFFEPWVYGIGLPHYFHGWAAEPLPDGRHQVRVSVRQPADSLFYPMPVDFEFVTDRGRTRRTVFIEHNPQTFTVIVDAAPTAVRFDPDGWILKTAEEEPLVPAPAPYSRLLDLRPMGASGAAPLRFSALLSPGDAVPLAVEVFDIAGRKIAEPFHGPVATGDNVIAWDGRTNDGADAGSGVYFARASVGVDVRTLKLVLTR